MGQSLRIRELLESSSRSYRRVSLRRGDAVEETMMGVPKGTRSSDSRRKVFARRVRELDVVVNWSISMLVVREGCQPPLRESCYR